MRDGDKEYKIAKGAAKKAGCHLPESHTFHSTVASTPAFIREYFYLKGFKEAQVEEIKKGCGDEFLSEDGDFELMCGKHIWEKPGKVSQYNLCPGCQSALNVLLGETE